MRMTRLKTELKSKKLKLQLKINLQLFDQAQAFYTRCSLFNKESGSPYKRLLQ